MFFIKRWKEQGLELKDQLIKSLEDPFGQNIFKIVQILKKSCKHLKIARDQYRRALKVNPKYDHPPMVPKQEWNEIIEDAKEIRLKYKGIKPPPRKIGMW